MKINIREKFLDPVLDRIGHLEKKYLNYFLGGALVFVFLLDYLILMRPQLGALMKVSPKIKLLSEQIQQTKEDFKKLNFYRKEVEVLEGQLITLREGLKAKAEIPLILERVSRIANNNHVRIDQLIPNMTIQDKLLENNKYLYFSLPIFVEGKAGYHDFARFINQLEQDDIFFDVKLFTVTAGQSTKKHNIRLTLNTIIEEFKL